MEKTVPHCVGFKNVCLDVEFKGLIQCKGSFLCSAVYKFLYSHGTNLNPRVIPQKRNAMKVKNHFCNLHRYEIFLSYFDFIAIDELAGLLSGSGCVVSIL